MPNTPTSAPAVATLATRVPISELESLLSSAGVDGIERGRTFDDTQPNELAIEQAILGVQL